MQREKWFGSTAPQRDSLVIFGDGDVFQSWVQSFGINLKGCLKLRTQKKVEGGTENPIRSENSISKTKKIEKALF